MTIGPRLALDVVVAITSLDVDDRDEWADAAGFYLDNYHRLDDDERRALAPGHVWCMCIEPSSEVRGYFLDSIDTLAVRRAISPTVVAEIQDWLAVTGTDRAEVDYVETFTEIVKDSGAVSEVPLTPERAAPLVDVLRGITSASREERARAASVVPELLPDLRREEQWGFTSVLARAAIVEDDLDVRRAQLEALATAHRVGAVHAHDSRLLGEAFAEVNLGPTERQIIEVLDTRRE